MKGRITIFIRQLPINPFFQNFLSLWQLAEMLISEYKLCEQKSDWQTLYGNRFEQRCLSFVVLNLGDVVVLGAIVTI